MNSIKSHLTPSGSMVVALVALLVAMSGSAVAASLITSKQIKDGTIQTKDLARTARASLKGEAGPPGPAGPAGAVGPKGDTGAPGPATGPAGGDLTGSYPNPAIRDGAVTATKLSPLEAWHVVGAASEPAFGLDWVDYGAGYQTVAFRKDRDGLVHLRGSAMRAANGNASSMFYLPAAYRPAHNAIFAVASTDGNGNPTPGLVEAESSGAVYVYGATDDRFVSLDGLTFEAGS